MLASIYISCRVKDTDRSDSTKTMMSVKYFPASFTRVFCKALAPKRPCKEVVPFSKSEVTIGKLII